jgi:hypothetical protein
MMNKVGQGKGPELLTKRIAVGAENSRVRRRAGAGESVELRSRSITRLCSGIFWKQPARGMFMLCDSTEWQWSHSNMLIDDTRVQRGHQTVGSGSPQNMLSECFACVIFPVA